MRERRKFFRFLRQRKTQYLSQGSIGNWQKCTIIDVSREGMKILLNEKFNLGSTICFKIPVPGELVPIGVNGTLKRIEERGNDFIAGIELTEVLDDEKFRQLLTGYSLSQKNISTKGSERRGFFRFLRQRKTQYFTRERTEDRQEGTIINVSRKGMTILFHEKINLGSTISLEIPVPGELTPIGVNGTLKRIEERGNDFIAGIELTEVLDDEKFRQLLMGYSLSQKKISTKLIKKASEDANAHRKETHLPLISKQHFTLPFFRKVFSLKGASVSLFSLLLFLSLIFSVERGYLPGNLLSEDKQKKDMVVQRKDVPSKIEPTEIVSNQLIPFADAHLATQNEPVVSREKGIHVAVLKEEGGSLYFLALKHYQRADETLFDLILQANPRITDVRQIHEDQKITLPVITSESYIKKVSDGTYQVYVGTFKTHNLATLYSTKVIDLGKPLIFDSHKFSSEDTWHRLLIGNFKSKEEALKTVTLLKEHAIIYVPPEQR